MVDKMLITLCYVYMWVRFHKCYSVLIRNSLSRLRSTKNSLCLSFFSGSSSVTAPPPAPPLGLHAADPHHHPFLPDDNVFLQLGDKAVYVTEAQVRNVSLAGKLAFCHPDVHLTVKETCRSSRCGSPKTIG